MHGKFLCLLFLHAHQETEAHFTATRMPIRLVPFQARGILPVAEEQSRTRGDQSGSVTDQPQCRGLWHSSSPNVRSLSHSPSSPPPSFTQSPSPPRSLVRDGQTRQISPHRLRRLKKPAVLALRTKHDATLAVLSSRGTEHSQRRPFLADRE